MSAPISLAQQLLQLPLQLYLLLAHFASHRLHFAAALEFGLQELYPSCYLALVGPFRGLFVRLDALGLCLLLLSSLSAFGGVPLVSLVRFFGFFRFDGCAFSSELPAPGMIRLFVRSLLPIRQYSVFSMRYQFSMGH